MLLHHTKENIGGKDINIYNCMYEWVVCVSFKISNNTTLYILLNTIKQNIDRKMDHVHFKLCLNNVELYILLDAT